MYKTNIKKILSLFLSVIMILSVTSGMTINANAEPRNTSTLIKNQFNSLSGKSYSYYDEDEELYYFYFKFTVSTEAKYCFMTSGTTNIYYDEIQYSTSSDFDDYDYCVLENEEWESGNLYSCWEWFSEGTYYVRVASYYTRLSGQLGVFNNRSSSSPYYTKINQITTDTKYDLSNYSYGGRFEDEEEPTFYTYYFSVSVPSAGNYCLKVYNSSDISDVVFCNSSSYDEELLLPYTGYFYVNKKVADGYVTNVITFPSAGTYYFYASSYSASLQGKMAILSSSSSDYPYNQSQSTTSKILLNNYYNLSSFTPVYTEMDYDEGEDVGYYKFSITVDNEDDFYLIEKRGSTSSYYSTVYGKVYIDTGDENWYGTSGDRYSEYLTSETFHLTKGVHTIEIKGSGEFAIASRDLNTFNGFKYEKAGNSYDEDEGEYIGFSYDSVDECTITGYTGSSTNIVFPDTINGMKVTVIGYRAFKEKRNITGVTMPKYLREVDYEAFKNCIRMASVKFNSSCISIGDSAFMGCTSISTLKLPNTIETIDERAFENCYSLTSVNYPDNLRSVESYGSFFQPPFNNCESLKSISISNTCTYIDGELMRSLFCDEEDCDEGPPFASLSIPANVTYINSLSSLLYMFNKVYIYNRNCKITAGSGGNYGQGKVYGYRNSTAQSIANTRHYSFVDIEAPVKKTNTLKVSGKTVTASYKTLKKQNVAIKRGKAITVSKPQGTVTYTKKSGNAKIVINKKNGNITVKKGLKKGTYTVKVSVKAAGTKYYKSATKTVTFKVKVK